MLNWRKLKNVTLAAAAASSALAGGTAHAAGVNKDFKFPIVLCRFKQAVLKDSGGSLKVVVDKDWGNEYAFPVGNVQSANGTLSGDFAGTYEIPNSSYRLRLEGDISQALDVAANHQLRLKTILEKKMKKADASGKLWQEVGQSANSVIAHSQSDGTVWENVYPYTFNSSEMQRYVVGGKLKQELVVAGIRDGLLNQGSVFKVGPACGFLDAKTAKSVASADDRQKYRSIFDQIPDSPAASVVAEQTQPQAPSPIELKISQPAPAEVAKAEPQTDERDRPQQPEQPEQQDQQQAVAQADGQAQAGQAMSPELQAQLAQQNQLADQAAAAYNFQQQQVENGLAQPQASPQVSPQVSEDGRDLASAQMPQQMPQANSVGQIAQNLQNLQNSEQIQQHMSMLERQREALAQQQSMIDQQQAFLAQRQQDMAANAAAQPAGDAQVIQTSQAAPEAAPQAGTMGQSF
jgi:hypothetical protein